jgi:carboxymethylenebutenolidase
VRLDLATGTPAELVRPDTAPGDTPPRGLVLLPDIAGLRPLMDDHVRRLSDATGWPVCAPEPWPGREHVPVPERLGLVGTLDDDAVLADVAAAADVTGAAEVAVLGFCMGGMYALKASATGRFRCAVSFYGMIRVPDQWASPTQAQPLDLMARGHAPVLAIIGSDDVWTPPDDVAALEAAGAEVVVYAGAEHGFVHDPDRDAYRPDDAADAWRRVLAFLTA